MTTIQKKLKPKELELYRRAIKCWGLDGQINHVIEELAELIVAIRKIYRGGNWVDGLVDETADVQIMLNQLQVAIEDNTQCRDFSDRVKERIKFKLARTMIRVKKAEGE